MFLPRSLSVQSKLIAAFVLLTLVTIGVVSWIGYVSARESLRAASERELMGLQRSKTALVQNILRSARNEALSLSASSATTNAARELLAAYRQLAREPVTAEMQAEVRRFYKEEFVPALTKRAAIDPPEDSLLPTTPTGWYLHYHYIATGPKPYGARRINRSATDKSAYGQAVARVLPELQGAVNRLEQGNLTLVDPETLDVFFSLEQSSVLGTNLVNGPYAASKMSKLVLSLRNSQNVDDYRVADFEAYYPSLGEPKAFVGTPVFDGPRMIAIMVLRLPIEPISKALSGNRQWEAEGLGKTGEVYLLGPDQTMRTDSRFLIEDRAAFLATLRRSTLTSRTVDTIEKLGTTILTVPVEHEAARAALRGETGVMAIPGYRGIPALMAYGPVDLDSLRWGVIAKIDEAEAMAPLGDYAKRVLTWGVGLSLLATVMALLLAKVLTRPITALVRAAKQVSQGALDVKVEVIATDEYRELGEAFNEMVASLRTNRAGAGPPGAGERAAPGEPAARPPARPTCATAMRRRASRSRTSPWRTSTSSGSSRCHPNSARTTRWPCSATSWRRATRRPSSTAWRRSAPSAPPTWPSRDCRWNAPTTPRAWSTSLARSCASSSASTPSAACASSPRSASTPDRSSAAWSAGASSSTTCGATP